jgi:hypothetical protein
VEAFQVSVTLFAVALVTESPPGAAGAVEPALGCVTALVAAEVALVDPLRLAATTLNRNVEPTSAVATLRVVSVAPLMGVQFPPLLPQRSH